MARTTKTKEKTNVSKTKQQKSGGISICLILTSALITLIAIASYTLYVNVTKVPDFPDIDLNVWWGLNTTELQDTSVRPFRIVFSDSMLKRLRDKFDLYRSNTNKKKSLTETWSYGVNSEALAQVFAHWQFKYPFRERVRYFNQFDHFKTKIQGLDIHFVHVKPQLAKNVKVQVLPLLMLHGWPGSIREFCDVIPLLTTVRPGYNFVFEVIVPSLPGFAYSQASSKPGLNPYQIAIIMRNLMHRLGFSQYYIQGGDLGQVIGSHMATLFQDDVLGFHMNWPINYNKFAFLTWVLGGVWPTLVADGLADWLYPVKDKVEFLLEETGYMHLQGTKPDTIGIALSDSPVGLAAYILDKFIIFTDPNNKYLEDGGLSNYPVTDLLDNIMLYVATNCISTSMRLYKESFRSLELEQSLARISTKVPTWGLRFKYELLHQPDFVLRWKYQYLLGTTNLDFGGHFAAFERPKELADDIFLAVNRFLAVK